MKLLIIGGVAGGATAAARARRLNEQAEIIVFERGEFISFANCGLPYYIGTSIQNRDDLMVTTPADFRNRYRIDVRTFSEVVAIDRKNKHVEVKNLRDRTVYRESYDKILLSPGASPIRPPIEGVNLNNIFSLRNIPDMDVIKAYVDQKKPASAVVVGGGFIGLEMAENLTERGVKTTIVEMLDQVMAPLDREMAAIVHGFLKEGGIDLSLGNAVTAFTQSGKQIRVSTKNGTELMTDLVILSIGVSPENLLARQAGLKTGEYGGITVDETMCTSDPDIYAVGDAVETRDFISQAPAIIPLAGPANKQARIAAGNIMGRKAIYPGALGTAVVKIFDKTVASTGQSEKKLQKQNIPYKKSYTFSGSHASYYPGAETMAVKLLFSPGNGRILGAQVIGGKGVDKRIDVLATAIHADMTVFHLETLELAYAPPYSSAKDPINVAGFVASNMLKKDTEVIHWHELKALDKQENILIDLRTREEIQEEGTIEGALPIPVDELRERLSELDREKTYIVFCAIGLRGYVAYRILNQNGFRAKNLSGGYSLFSYVNML
ncbi:MAG: CoA-disulfide reductase [Desulfobacteraceae bacterium]|nr:MAG: CoA-disulfide reductase [Desulfobacteraceae bacterium]